VVRGNENLAVVLNFLTLILYIE